MIDRPIAIAIIGFLVSILACISNAQSASHAGDEPIDVDLEQWGGLARYRDANRRLEPNPGRVVFIGDSITEGWSEGPFFTDHPNFVDRGISGESTAQMLLRFHADVIALKPAVVHIMGGTNDVAGNDGKEFDEEIEANLISMVQLARFNRIRVVLVSIPPAAGFQWRPSVRDAATRIQRLNAWIKAYAHRNRLTYVDYWSALSDSHGAFKSSLSEDGVHPNEAGYAVMQPLTLAAIAEASRPN